MDFLEVFVFIVSRGLFEKGVPRTDPYTEKFYVIVMKAYDPLLHSSCCWWMLFFLAGLLGRCLCQRVVVPVQHYIYIYMSAHILVDFDDLRSRYLATGVQSPCSQET